MGVRNTKEPVSHNLGGTGTPYDAWGSYVHGLLRRMLEPAPQDARKSIVAARGDNSQQGGNPIYVLRLRNMNLRLTGANLIYLSLLDNKTITELDLKGNGFGPSGVLYFAELLKLSVTILELDLGSNLVGDAGAKVIAQNLERNNSLRRLDLSDNYIHEAGCKALSLAVQFNDTLVELNLSKNSIGKAGCRHLAAGLMYTHTLQTLVLQDNNLDDASLELLSKGIKNNRSLSELCLAKNKFTGEGVHYLMQALQTGSANIRLLDLSNNELGPMGCKHLCILLPLCKKLLTLLLRSNRIGDTGCKHLSETLGGLTGADLKLRCLDISDNGIGKTGVEDLAGVLEEGSSVTSIDFSYNEIGMEGGQAVLNMIQNRHIRDCRVRNTCMGPLLTQKIRDRIQQNRALLAAIDLSDSDEEEDKQQTGDDGAMDRCESVVSDMQATPLTRPFSVASMHYVPSSAKLSRGTQALSRGTQVQEPATPAVAHRPRVIGKFTVLRVGERHGDVNISTRYDHTVADMRKFGDPDKEEKRTCVDVTRVEHALERLQQNDKSQTSVILAGQRLGNSDSSMLLVKQLGISLTYNVTARIVDLTCNNLGPLGAKLLAKAMAPNDTLTEVSLSGNHLGPSGAAALQPLFSINRTLLTLSLDDNGIGDLGMRHIADFFCRGESPSVTCLNLQWNNITKNSGPSINRLLKHPTNLKVLNLCGNAIGNNGLLDFCEDETTGIYLNTTLQTLDVSRNFIGDKGAWPLLSGILHNSTMHYVGIGDNVLSPMVVQSFLEYNEGKVAEQKRIAAELCKKEEDNPEPGMQFLITGDPFADEVTNSEGSSTAPASPATSDRTAEKKDADAPATTPVPVLLQPPAKRHRSSSDDGDKAAGAAGDNDAGEGEDTEEAAAAASAADAAERAPTPPTSTGSETAVETEPAEAATEPVAEAEPVTEEPETELETETEAKEDEEGPQSEAEDAPAVEPTVTAVAAVFGEVKKFKPLKHIDETQPSAEAAEEDVPPSDKEDAAGEAQPGKLNVSKFAVFGEMKIRKAAPAPATPATPPEAEADTKEAGSPQAERRPSAGIEALLHGVGDGVQGALRKLRDSLPDIMAPAPPAPAVPVASSPSPPPSPAPEPPVAVPEASDAPASPPQEEEPVPAPAPAPAPSPPPGKVSTLRSMFENTEPEPEPPRPRRKKGASPRKSAEGSPRKSDASPHKSDASPKPRKSPRKSEASPTPTATPPEPAPPPSTPPPPPLEPPAPGTPPESPPASPVGTPPISPLVDAVRVNVAPKPPPPPPDAADTPDDTPEEAPSAPDDDDGPGAVEAPPADAEPPPPPVAHAAPVPLPVSPVRAPRSAQSKPPRTAESDATALSRAQTPPVSVLNALARVGSSGGLSGRPAAPMARPRTAGQTMGERDQVALPPPPMGGGGASTLSRVGSHARMAFASSPQGAGFFPVEPADAEDGLELVSTASEASGDQAEEDVQQL